MSLLFLLLALLQAMPVIAASSAAPATEEKTPSAVKAQKGRDTHSLPGRWRETANMAIARVHHTATLLPNGKVLVVGGHTAQGVSRTAELFDPAANGGKGAWRATGALHHARVNHTATLLANGKVLVIGGGGGGDSFPDDPSLISAELYDPAADGGRGAWTMAGSLKKVHYRHLAIRLSTGNILIVGGHDDGEGSGAIELYDPVADNGKGASVVLGDDNLGVRPAATLLPNGEVLILGDEPHHEDCGQPAIRLILSNDQRTIHIVASDDMRDLVFTGARAKSDLCQPTAALLPDGRVLVVGISTRWDREKQTSEDELRVLLYDYTKSSEEDLAGAWVDAPAPVGAGELATVLLNGTVLFTGGSVGGIYDPTGPSGVGRWTMTGKMKASRRNHTATLLSDGSVLVAGGEGELKGKVVSLASAEIYEPTVKQKDHAPATGSPVNPTVPTKK